jgi:hypothetical protein
MNRFTRWWNRDKIAKQAIEDNINNLMNKVDALNIAFGDTKIELDKANIELESYRKQDEEDDEKRNGTTPWVEIKSDSVDPVKGIQIELDWNDAFIQYLKDSGLSAKDDDSLVQKWIAMLYVDLLDKFEQQHIDDSDIIGNSEFE